jgi:hypothetical protein
LHGWAKGLIDAGWEVIGVDIEDMSRVVGEPKPDHFHLLIQNVLSIHGKQLKDARLIVSSSPCTKYSYMAMPWKRAKDLAAWYRDPEHPERLTELNALYDAQFRIQREACEAAGRHIPMVVENVRGAIPWVGRAKYHYGSYYLWGDVPVLMPQPTKGAKTPGRSLDKDAAQKWGTHNMGPGDLMHAEIDDYREGVKTPGFRFDGSGRSFQTASVAEHVKGSEGYERDHPNAFGWKKPNTTSKGRARKAASAKIARIPFALSSWIGKVYLPR